VNKVLIINREITHPDRHFRMDRPLAEVTRLRDVAQPGASAFRESVAGRRSGCSPAWWAFTRAVVAWDCSYQLWVS
jgi:hypothetical protein